MSNFFKFQYFTEGIFFLLIGIFLAPSVVSVTGPRGIEILLRGLNVPFQVEIQLVIIGFLLLSLVLCAAGSFWIANQMDSSAL